MRTVFPSREIPHLWAHSAQSEARGRGNIFFRGDIIYSYGTHFPIARHVIGRDGTSRAILFTTRDYSVTTSGHKSRVRRALPTDRPVFYVPNPADTDPDCEESWRSYQERIRHYASKAARARSNRPWYLRQLESTVSEANQFREFFGLSYAALSVPRDIKQALADWTEEDKEREAAALAKLKAAQAKALRRARALLGLWKKGKEVRLPYLEGPAFLRIRGDEIETSHGARVPLAHAVRILPFIRSGKTYQHNGHSIHLGHYRVDAIGEDGTLRAGCHVITRDEIERIAEQLGL